MEELKAVIVLEDGSTWHGKGFGAEAKVSGEVVFNTGMVGYTESVTDPSYRGQILCQTYPLIGNYGVNRADFESEKIQITGYIVSEACRFPSHHSSQMTLHKWLEQSGVPGIEGIDTRELTKKIRTKGVMLGILQTYRGDADIERLKEEAKSIEDPNKRDLIDEVSVKEEIVYGPQNSGAKHITIVAVDSGIKMNIIRCLVERGVNVVRVPAKTAAERIIDHKPAGVLFANGPGDPQMAPYIVDCCRAILEYRVPVMGICLGQQMLALALGGSTYKLKFGHRGQNHPVIEMESGACFMTSQNHGFAVALDSLNGKGVKITHTHANDRSVEGLESERHNAVGFQWHPEHSPGPMDTQLLFDRFIKRCRDGK